MKGLKEGLAATSLAVAMAGAADARAQETLPVIPDPDVRATACTIFAYESEEKWNLDELRHGYGGMAPAVGLSGGFNRTAAYAECMEESAPAEPTPAETRQTKCAEVANMTRGYVLWLLGPQGRDTAMVAEGEARINEEKCLADEEQAARARCDEEGKRGTDPALSMMLDHHLGFGRDRKGERSPWDITSACLANEGLKP